MTVKKSILSITFTILLTFSTTPVFASEQETCETCAEYAELGLPSDDGTLLCRTGYLLAHDEEFKTPIWVIERLTREKAQAKLPRKDNFRADPDLESDKRAELSDYKNSGYDRGHMAPSADFTWSAVAMAESFYLSNMVPQNNANNTQIWANLEAQVRDWAIVRGEVFIFTGPVYDNDEAQRTIGKNRVGIPDRLFKIVYDPAAKEAIAFLLPNEAIETKLLPNYIVSVRFIEYLTGLNFLSNLPRKEQNKIEKTKTEAMWDRK